MGGGGGDKRHVSPPPCQNMGRGYITPIPQDLRPWLEMTILREICGFCNTTSLLYKWNREHIPFGYSFYIYLANSKVQF